MPVCGECHSTFKKAHKCRAGKCTTCGTSFANLTGHKCAYSERETFDSISQKPCAIRCDGCEIEFFQNKMKVFKGMNFCQDCIAIPEIKIDQISAFEYVTNLLLARGDITCELCHVQIFENIN